MDIEALEATYAEYRTAFERGELDAETFQAAIDELRAQDDYGRYWMLGAESGQWYCYDGVDWIQADPTQADSVPYIDEHGVYWMLGQDSQTWHFYDGEQWVQAEPDAAFATAQDESEYYLDDQGRYWTIGKKSGEWYFYDDQGWHKATDTPNLDQLAGSEAPDQQPYQPTPQSTPAPYTVPFQPIQPDPGSYQPHPTATDPATNPVAAQNVTQPVQPVQPYGPPVQPTPAADPYAYTQPVQPQSAPPPSPSQPVYPPQPAPYSEPVPAQPAPVESTEPGVWLYYDGQRWLKYRDDDVDTAEGMAELDDEAYLDDEDVYADDPYYEDDLSEDETIIPIDDIDDFVEVVEVDEEDIIDLDEEEPLIEAEFQVEVLRPNERSAQAAPPVEPVQDPEPVTAKTSEPAKPAAEPAAPAAKPEVQPSQTSTAPKAARVKSPKAQLDAKALPTWFLTSVGSIVALVLVAFILIGILYSVNNRAQFSVATVIEPTATLAESAPVSTPTVAPTPPPTPTVPPTNTPVALSDYSSDYFGLTVQYPAGWVYQENDNIVAFAPSTRALDTTAINGAVLWVTTSDNTDVTELLAEALEQFEPIAETLNEGAMKIGSEQWLSAQVRFNSASLGEDAIGLVASTTRNEAGYILVAIAPAAEWEAYVPLFQYPLNSLAFSSTLAVAQVTEEGNSTDDDNSGQSGQSTRPATPTATPTVEEVASEPFTYEVQSGDTLLGIAIDNDVSLEDLIAANNLGDSNAILRIGQELLIPGTGDAVAAVPATSTSEAATSTATTEAVTDDDDESPVAATPTEAAATPTTVPATATPAPTDTPEPVAVVSGRIVYPAYSTDIQSFNVWSSNTDGSDPLIIAGNASQPSFNDTGTLFTYRSWEPSSRGIYFVDYAGGRQDLLTSFIEDGLPVWNKGGTIIFSSRREGDRIPRLFRVDQNKNDVSLGFVSEHFDIMPDGHLIARGCTLSGDCGLFRLLPDGTGEQKISGDTSDTAPAVSPSGGRVAIMSFDRAGASNWEIWTINPDGSDAQRLTENGANDGLPAWSPDGNSIAFVSDRGGVWAIWAMDSNGGNQRKLFNMQGPPDGQVLRDVPNSRGWLEERIDWIP